MSQENIALVKGSYEAFQRGGDLDGVLAVFDPDIEWFIPGPEELPFAGTCQGHARVREFFAALDETIRNPAL